MIREEFSVLVVDRCSARIVSHTLCFRVERNVQKMNDSYDSLALFTDDSSLTESLEALVKSTSDSLTL